MFGADIAFKKTFGTKDIAVRTALQGIRGVGENY